MLGDDVLRVSLCYEEREKDEDLAFDYEVTCMLWTWLIYNGVQGSVYLEAIRGTD